MMNFLVVQNGGVVVLSNIINEDYKWVVSSYRLASDFHPSFSFRRNEFAFNEEFSCRFVRKFKLYFNEIPYPSQNHFYVTSVPKRS